MSPSNSANKAKQTSRQLVAAFIAVLLLMAFIAATGLVYLQRSNQSLQQIVQIENIKTGLLYEMRDAMRQRQLSIRDMSMSADPFTQDQAWQRHNEAATRFLLARDSLYKLVTSKAEEDAHQLLRESVTKGGLAQQTVVQMIQAGNGHGNIAKALDDAISAQNVAFQQLEILIGKQRKSAQEALDRASADYLIMVFIAIAVGGGCLIVGIIISYFVIREYNSHMQLIHRYQDHLEELVQERTRELESYSYTLAHDLRTPLRAVTSFSQIMLEDSGGKLDESERNILSRIANAGKYMAQMIDDILTLGRISRAELCIEQVDLSKIADQVLYEFRLTRQTPEFSTSIEEGLVTRADPSMMRLLFQHLFENSLKFTQPGESAKLEFGRFSHKPETWFVRDNGIGFDSQYTEKIFDAFERLHKAEEFTGTGVGLAIVERIIKRHDGEIRAESQPGQGTTFYFTLGNG